MKCASISFRRLFYNRKSSKLIMLELDVVPERSLGCEQWEFILGNVFYLLILISEENVA